MSDSVREQQSHQHCWHQFYGALGMVLHSGETVQECCKCHEHRVIHREHAHER